MDRLGKALAKRVEEVLERVMAKNAAAGVELDEAVQLSLERICTSSTLGVSHWMTGGDPKVDRSAAEEVWELFGQLTAHGAVPLNELTRRCLRWRDAVEEVLAESAGELRLSAATTARALATVRYTLDATLVRMCKVFDSERVVIEKELARRQEELVFMATHDGLTGMPNRTLILDRGNLMLARARRSQAPVAALQINLDNFKTINDTLGHSRGDLLLQAIAARLDGVVREADALGRLGGDEFVVLAEGLSLAAGAELVAERLLEALKAPFTLAGEVETQLKVTASIGIATGDRGSAEDLLRDADIAMHRAKWEGKNRFVVFESGMQDVVQCSMELEMDLRNALERDEFFLVYQPTFDLNSLAPTGVETLLRWKHPLRGVVQPNDFIPLLEDTGLIVEVGRWVLDRACTQGARWRAAGHAVGVAVNVSARQLDTDELVDDVRGAVARSGLEPSALTLEITETALMRNPEDTARTLRELKRLGVRIAIDDFGTGYSSMAHLQRFPVDALKIDRSFICQLADNPEGEMIIRTLVKLGKALSIETLAEGIEHPHELSLLQEERCDSGQGFLFARPLEVCAAQAFLEGWLEDGARSAASPPPAA